jgi:hypothetical protein
MRVVARRGFSLFAAALSLAIAGAMPACSSGNHSGGTQPALIPSLASPVADVPIPAGFVMTGASTSQVVPSSGLRFVDHQYKGGDDVLPVVRFYREQLPAKGWNLIDQNQLHHEVTLRFTKNNEDAIITVWPGTLDTHIRVRIDPAGRSTAK